MNAVVMSEAVEIVTPRESAREAASRFAKTKLAHGFKGYPLHRWREADGTVRYFVIRLKHPETGKKWVRPMHLTAAGEYVLEKPPAPETGRILYNLPALLAADPDTPLFIVEGEACADELMARGVLATTSGGASSADSADWTPAQKFHDVRLWPDNDPTEPDKEPPGMKYAADVAAKLRDLTAVATPVTEKVPGKREKPQPSSVEVRLIAPEIVEALPEKGDCVNWLAEHPDATAADILALPMVPYTPSNNIATVQPPPAEPPAIAHEQRILERFREVIRGCGVVGEECNAATVYLAITSRLLDKLVSLAIKGPSSSGKSYTTEKTVEFFPKEAVIEMTAMSERALVYSKEEYTHRTMILYEATALRENSEDNLTSYFVRSLLSEGRIEYPVTVRDPAGGWMTKTIVKEGPTNLIITTTKTRVHAENETRLLSLNTNDTREQTRAIFRALADESSAEPNKSEWHDLQRWLQSDKALHKVTVPYARQLAELIPPVAVRLRRDFGALLALIRTHAILHQLNRETDAEGRIVATVDDYAEVRELVAHLIAEGVGSTVHETVRETVEAVEALAVEGGVMARAVAERLKLDKSTASRRLRMASDGGYIRNLEERRGKPGRWVKGDPLPEKVDLLPQPCNLEPSETRINRGGCTVASVNQGVEESAENAESEPVEPEPVEFDEEQTAETVEEGEL